MSDPYIRNRLRLYVSDLGSLRRLREHARKIGAKNFSRYLVSMALRGARLERTARQRREERLLTSHGSLESQLNRKIEVLDEEIRKRELAIGDLDRRDLAGYRSEIDALRTATRRQRGLLDTVKRLVLEARAADRPEASREAVDEIARVL